MGLSRAMAALATGVLTFAGGAALMLGPVEASSVTPSEPVTVSASASPSGMLPVTVMNVSWATLKTGLFSLIAGFAILLALLVWRARVRERRARIAWSQMMLSPFNSSAVKPSFTVTPIRPELPPASGTLSAAKVNGGWTALKAGLLSAAAGSVVVLAAKMWQSRARRSRTSRRHPRHRW